MNKYASYKEFLQKLNQTNDTCLKLVSEGIKTTINDIMVKLPESTIIEIVFEKICEESSSRYYVYYKIFKSKTVLVEQICYLTNESKLLLMGLSDICSFIYTI